jgi:hypothetical protein
MASLWQAAMIALARRAGESPRSLRFVPRAVGGYRAGAAYAALAVSLTPVLFWST